jgi:segregation and condensation protein A
MRTFQAVLDRAKNRPTYEIENEDVSVPDMIRYLRNVFGKERADETVSARELFERQRSRRAMICLFLALLELVKLQAVGLVQTDSFGEIGLKRLDGFETAFASDEDSDRVMTTIDEGYN